MVVDLPYQGEICSTLVISKGAVVIHCTCDGRVVKYRAFIELTLHQKLGRTFSICVWRNHHGNGRLNAQDMTTQSDHLASKSEEGDSWLPLLPVIRLPLGCHLAQAD